MERVYDTDEDEYFLIPKTITKKTPKFLLNLKLNLNLNLKVISTPEISLNVKNVMQNLKIK